VDTRTTTQNIQILKAYGAIVEQVMEPDPVSGDLLHAKLNRVKQIIDAVPHSYWPNQYANRNNSAAHHHTMREIIHQTGGSVDYLFCATSTCGTLRGCAEFVREHGLRTRIIAVDAIGSAIFGGKSCNRLLPGHGTARTPELYETGLVDDYVQVGDLDCVIGCRQLMTDEAILAGGSSGGVLMAVHAMLDRIEPGATCVMILPDRGERYLNTVYSRDWIREHFADASLELPATNRQQTPAPSPLVTVS
jgi:cysteine synthase A